MAKIFYALEHEQFHPEVLIKHARLAEDAGFDGVFVSEHFNPWVADKGASGFALSTLGAIATGTTKLQMMTGVITPLFRYHPASVAQAAATLDRLSNGRFILGVGTGESINEAALGYHFPAYKERSARMKEALEIIPRLLHGERISYQGEFYTTQNAFLYSPPLHQVPILLAAGGTKTAELAGEYADGIVISVKDPAESIEKIITPAVQFANNRKKASFSIASSRWSVFANDDNEAWSALGAWRGLRAPSRSSATDPRELQKEADALPRVEILSRYTVVSSAQEYIDAYAPLITKLHSDIVTIQTTGTDQEKIIALLGKEVVPALQSLS